MGQSQAPLSRVLADAASAVVSTQEELDRRADMKPADSSLAPLAFVVKQTQLSLLGQLSVQDDSASAACDPVLTFSQIGRVQAGLYGSRGTLISRIFISIEVIEPDHVH